MLLILTIVIIIGKNSFLAEILPFLGNLVPVIHYSFCLFLHRYLLCQRLLHFSGGEKFVDSQGSAG